MKLTEFVSTLWISSEFQSLGSSRSLWMERCLSIFKNKGKTCFL